MPHDQGESAALETAERHYLAGRLDQAEAVARRLVKQRGAPAQAIMLLSRILLEGRKAPQAVFELERAVKEQPGDTDLRMLLHNAYVAEGRVARALAVAEQAAALRPESDDAMNAIASLHMSEGRVSEAEAWYRRARETNPESTRAAVGLARVMGASFRGREAVDLLRQEIGAGRRSNRVLQMLALQLQYVSGVDPREVLEAQQAAGRMVMREADGLPPRVSVSKEPDRKLTIGYLSPDFRQHSCAHFIEPLLAARDKGRFRVIAYSSTAIHDAVTERLRPLVDVWRDVAAMKDQPLANLIASDKVDIAIDLAGHTSGSRMSCLAMRPAPVTMNYIGYPSTTGAPGIDYRIVDWQTDPQGAEGLATERLIRLDSCFLCFRPPAGAPDVGPAPCAETGRVTFGSFNILDKVSDATLDCWSAVLARVLTSRMLLKTKPLADAAVCERVRGAFATRGVAPDRLELIAWTKGVKEHLDLYRRVDIALDTVPYNGTTTTCESLWMGVPVITLRGGAHAGRVGSSILSAVGLPDLVAADAEWFVETAAALAADPAKLGELRAGLRARMSASPLRDESVFASRFEAALVEVWRSWCRGG